jgi:regulator of cell morphogenesis and NO signaling
MQAIDISPDSILNDLVARAPEVLPVMHQWDLDSCCGGAISLREAAAHHNLSLDDLIEALRSAVERGAA